jgi:hypothetical protein
MARRNHGVLRELLGVDSIAMFFLVFLLLPLASMNIYDLLKRAIGEDLHALAWLAVMCILLLFLSIALFTWRVDIALSRMAKIGRLPGFPEAPRRRGLICMVSNNEPAIRKAIDHCGDRLEHCWLLHTEDFATVADRLRQAIVERGIKAKLEPVSSQYDHQATEEVVNRVYRSLPDNMTEADVVADMTGGTKAMTAGMVLACLPMRRPLQYVPHRQLADGRLLPLDPIYVHVARA